MTARLTTRMGRLLDDGHAGRLHDDPETLAVLFTLMAPRLHGKEDRRKAARLARWYRAEALLGGADVCDDDGPEADAPDAVITGTVVAKPCRVA